MYDTIINDNICSYTDDLFVNYTQLKLNCVNLDSNSTSYGLNVVITKFIENIRSVKFNYDLQYQQDQELGFTYNNTLYNTSFDPSLSTNNSTNTTNNQLYRANDPFNIFNSEDHLNILLINQFLLKPTMEALVTQIETSINNSGNNFRTIYIIILSIFISGLTAAYFFIWMPFVNRLNQTVIYIFNI